MDTPEDVVNDALTKLAVQNEAAAAALGGPDGE